MENGILTDDERKAIEILSRIYPKCKGDCVLDGIPCELLNHSGMGCIAMQAYLDKVRLELE